MATDVGGGAEIHFESDLGTANLLTEPLNINWTGMSRPAAETTYLGTTTGATFIPGDVADPGELTTEINLDAETVDWFAAIGGAAENVGIKLPGATWWTCSGFMTAFEANIPGPNEVMTVSVTLKLSGTAGTTTTAP
ncbi:MAG: hypothetical protein ACE5FM_00100 [Methyloligellaceae bacterium]